MITVRCVVILNMLFYANMIITSSYIPNIPYDDVILYVYNICE